MVTEKCWFVYAVGPGSPKLVPISRWSRLPYSGTEGRARTFQPGRQSPRWGIIEQFGNISDVIVGDVFSVVAAAGNCPTVRSLEKPSILIIALDRKPTLMNKLVMLRTQEHQIIETGLTPG